MATPTHIHPESLQPTTSHGTKSNGHTDPFNGSLGLYLILSLFVLVLVCAVTCILWQIHIRRGARRLGNPHPSRTDSELTLPTFNAHEPKIGTRPKSRSRVLHRFAQRFQVRRDTNLSKGEKQQDDLSRLDSSPSTLPKSVPSIVISYCSPTRNKGRVPNPRYSLTNLQVPLPQPKKPSTPAAEFPPRLNEFPPLRPYNRIRPTLIDQIPARIEANKRRLGLMEDKENSVPVTRKF